MSLTEGKFTPETLREINEIADFPLKLISEVHSPHPKVCQATFLDLAKNTMQFRICWINSPIYVFQPHSSDWRSGDA